jgi:hypothetical protein
MQATMAGCNLKKPIIAFFSISLEFYYMRHASVYHNTFSMTKNSQFLEKKMISRRRCQYITYPQEDLDDERRV